MADYDQFSEQDYEDDVPDSPSLDTEVQGRVDSIALAQKRLSAEKASRVDSPQPTKSRFGRVKLPEESPEPDDKKIGVASGVFPGFLEYPSLLTKHGAVLNATFTLHLLVQPKASKASLDAVQRQSMVAVQFT